MNSRMKKGENYNRDVAAAFILIIITLFIIKFIELQYAGRTISEPIRQAMNLEKRNGIVTNIWLDEHVKLDNLRNHGMRYLIVDVGDTASNGKLKTSKEEIKEFIDFIRTYEKQENY